MSQGSGAITLSPSTFGEVCHSWNDSASYAEHAPVHAHVATPLLDSIILLIEHFTIGFLLGFLGSVPVRATTRTVPLGQHDKLNCGCDLADNGPNISHGVSSRHAAEVATWSLGRDRIWCS